MIAAAAACAALPFRSLPHDAAVADAFGTLLVSEAETRTRSRSRPSSSRDDLRDLGEQALPHLGPAVIEEHAAVGVDVHQGAAWFRCVAVKEMPNFTGVIAMPRLMTGLVAFQRRIAARRAA